MKVNGRDYRTVWMQGNTVCLIEQNLLPFEFKIFHAENYRQTCPAAKEAGNQFGQQDQEHKAASAGASSASMQDVEKSLPYAGNCTTASRAVRAEGPRSCLALPIGLGIF